ncbi:MAG: beta-lactamase family protein [Acidimicrobiaceae bacterium]|nr:beta-lactamase family protein [Acidimicrobiaceae bacterium]
MKVDADAAGMDAARLARIDEHLTHRYIEPGKIAGCLTAVVRHGAVAHFSCLGFADRERQRPVADDTIWRAYSMTKPITGVALMTLYERGMFQLNDPVDRFIPSWKGIKVKEQDGRLVEPQRPPSVKDVMMHTAGLGYGPANADLDPGVLTDRRRPSPMERAPSLEALAEQLAGEPLRFHPGTHWLYSFGTDVCARLVEVMSGRRFDEYLQSEIFEPLGMVDTAFSVPDSKLGRFAANYGRSTKKELVLVDDPEQSAYRKQPTFLSGGGGLVSTALDYLRFVQMLVQGGELEGRRVLGRKTVGLMGTNHLPANARGTGRLTMADFALPGGYGETEFDGMGFGLTMAVALGPAATGVIGSAGEFMWGGAASTIFWVDPAEELGVVFMTQLMPSGTFNFRGQLKSLVYPAIVD